jgi:hypothetical protein
MILRTSGEANRSGWGVCERALKLHLFRKGLSGQAKAKTGIGKSDLPGLQGGPGKRGLCDSWRSARASALSRPRELGSLHPEAIRAAVEETKPSEPLV